MASKAEKFLSAIGIDVNLRSVGDVEEANEELLLEAEDDEDASFDIKDLGFDMQGPGTQEAEISEDDFYKFYSLLDKSDMVEEDDASSLIADEGRSIQFVNDDFVITLIDDNEMCKITIKAF